VPNSTHLSEPSVKDLVLLQLITADRLRSYRRATNGDDSNALALYNWNNDMCGAVLSTTLMIEVIVRNAFDLQLTTRIGQNWFDLITLDAQGDQTLTKARNRATDNGRKQEQHGKVIAKLSLGFWRYLAAKRYLTSLWIPALANAFPNGSPDLKTRRAEVEGRLSAVLFIRNRAAHGEPLHQRDLLGDLAAATELGDWIHPLGGRWIYSNSRIQQGMQNKPA
jgi:hypothetical protein